MTDCYCAVSQVLVIIEISTQYTLIYHFFRIFITVNYFSTMIEHD